LASVVNLVKEFSLRWMPLYVAFPHESIGSTK
jgi:hypothetical protein